MGPFSISNNAIGWAKFRIRGGWKSVLTVSGVYLFIIVAGMLGTTRLADVSPSNVYSVWMNGLLGFQAFLLLIIIPARVGSAVRADLTSKVIESHRLMPTSGLEGVLGYVVGPNVHTLFMCAVTLAVGVQAAAGAGVMAERWVIANALLATEGVLLSVMAAFGGFLSRKFGLTIAGIVASVIFSQGHAAQLLPGLLVFCAPFIRKTIFSMQAGTDLAEAYVISVIFETALAGLFLAATARLYRRAGAIGFTPLMGLALLALWVAASAIALVRPDYFRLDLYRRGLPEEVQLVGSILVSLLLAFVPVSAVARRASAIKAARRTDSYVSDVDASRIPGAVILCTSMVVVMLLMRSASTAFARDRIMAVGVVVMSCLLTFYSAFRVVYRVSQKALGAGSLLMGLTWILPLLIALIPGIVDRFETGVNERWYGTIASFGPPGAISVLLAQRSEDIPLWGIGGQACFTLLMLLLLARSERSPRPKVAPAAAPA